MTAVTRLMPARSRGSWDEDLARHFETDIRKTIDGYLANEDWVQEVTTGNYRQWMDAQYSLETGE